MVNPMTRPEFVQCVAYLTAGSGKALAPEAMEVYFDCLSDLTPDVMALASKRVLMEHKFATFPSIAELREAAAETQRGQVKELTAAEGWALAWKVAGNTDPEVSGSFERASKGIPAIVVDAIRAFGLFDLCYGKDPVGVVRGQFMRIFEQLAARQKRMALMPPKLKSQIEGVGKTHAALTAGIGADPNDVKHESKPPVPVREMLKGIGEAG